MSPSSRGRGLKYRWAVELRRERRVALFTRAWIEITASWKFGGRYEVALFTRAWIEIHLFLHALHVTPRSPSSRGRGLKYWNCQITAHLYSVALFTRAWIEINKKGRWRLYNIVALFTRAWIEILACNRQVVSLRRRPLHEGVDWNFPFISSNLFQLRSPSSRGRGLKFLYTALQCLLM